MRITFEHGLLKIEKWSRNKCIERTYISHYSQTHDQKARDITNPRFCPDNTLFLKQEVYRLILTQKKEGFTIARINLKQEGDLDFSDPNLLEVVFEHKFEDAANAVTDIMIDTLPEKRIDVYVLFQNYQMKKWSAAIPPLGLEVDTITFEESPHEYAFEFFGKEKAQNAQKGMVPIRKNIKLAKNFIANQIFYSTFQHIELSLNEKEKPEKKS